jgi:hypothetical protein
MMGAPTGPQPAQDDAAEREKARQAAGGGTTAAPGATPGVTPGAAPGTAPAAPAAPASAGAPAPGAPPAAPTGTPDLERMQKGVSSTLGSSSEGATFGQTMSPEDMERMKGREQLDLASRYGGGGKAPASFGVQDLHRGIPQGPMAGGAGLYGESMRQADMMRDKLRAGGQMPGGWGAGVENMGGAIGPEMPRPPMGPDAGRPMPYGEQSPMERPAMGGGPGGAAPMPRPMLRPPGPGPVPGMRPAPRPAPRPAGPQMRTTLKPMAPSASPRPAPRRPAPKAAAPRPAPRKQAPRAAAPRGGGRRR